MSDAASFDPIALQRIWGSQPGCALTGEHRHVELHHILGRGGKYGRALHSSVLNAIPLDHALHASGYRDHKLMRELFLEIVYKRVTTKVREGEYEYTENDRAFLNAFHGKK